MSFMTIRADDKLLVTPCVALQGPNDLEILTSEQSVVDATIHVEQGHELGGMHDGMHEIGRERHTIGLLLSRTASIYRIHHILKRRGGGVEIAMASPLDLELTKGATVRTTIDGIQGIGTIGS